MTRVSRRLSMVLQLAALPLPWVARRWVLRRLLGFRIADTARIGRSLVDARAVELADGATVGHLTMVKGLSRLVLGQHASLGNLNWVTGFPIENTRFFAHVANRDPSLVIERHSSITHRHLVDCTDLVHVGPYCLVAGYASQILTHSVTPHGGQDCKPIRIGEHCFIGTRVIFLPGAGLAPCTVVGAGSVLTKPVAESYKLVSGVPAAPVRDMPPDTAFFLWTDIPKR